MLSDIEHTRHGIQLDDYRYVILHGLHNEGLHRVCIVKNNGTIIQSYGGNRRSDFGQLNEPGRILMFGDSLIVADYYNTRRSFPKLDLTFHFK
jgi:hypothetical protein